MKIIKKIIVLILIITILIISYKIYQNYEVEKYIKTNYEQYYENNELIGVFENKENISFKKDPIKKENISLIKSKTTQNDVLNKLNVLQKNVEINSFSEIIITDQNDPISIENEKLIISNKYLERLAVNFSLRNLVDFDLQIDNAKNISNEKKYVEGFGNVYPNSIFGKFISQFWLDYIDQYNEAYNNKKIIEFGQKNYKKDIFINEQAASSPSEDYYLSLEQLGNDKFYSAIIPKNKKKEFAYKEHKGQSPCIACNPYKVFDETLEYGKDLLTYKKIDGSFILIDKYGVDEYLEKTSAYAIDILVKIIPENYFKNFQDIIFYEDMDGFAASITPTTTSDDILLNIPLDIFNSYEDFTSPKFIATVVHELGHEVFMGSKQADDSKYLLGIGLEFQNKYWENEKEQLCLNTKKCDNLYNANNYISSYAATNVFEDTASNFAFFVLSVYPTGNLERDDKIKYFYNFNFLVDLRNEIRNNIDNAIPNFNYDEYNVNIYRWE